MSLESRIFDRFGRMADVHRIGSSLLIRIDHYIAIMVRPDSIDEHPIPDAPIPMLDHLRTLLSAPSGDPVTVRASRLLWLCALPRGWCVVLDGMAYRADAIDIALRPLASEFRLPDDELRVSCSSETGALRLEGRKFTALVMRLSEVDGESIDLRAAVDGRQVRA